MIELKLNKNNNDMAIIAFHGYGSNPYNMVELLKVLNICLLYTSPSPRDKRQSRMPSSA